MSNWRSSDFISGRVSVSQQYFIKYHHHRLSDVQKTTISTISLLYDLVNLGDNILCFLVIVILVILIFFLSQSLQLFTHTRMLSDIYICVYTYLSYCTSFINNNNNT